MTATDIAHAGESWAAQNRQYLLAELNCLRARIHRRVLWMRSTWKADALQPYQGLVISDEHIDRLLARPEPEAEARFYREDPKALALSRRLAALRRDADAAADTLRRAERPSPLDVLSSLFGLSPFERDVLLVCLAQEVDPAFDRFYAYLHDDVTRPHPTAHLAMTLFDEEEASWEVRWTSLLPDAPLRRFRLVHANAGAMSRSSETLRIDRRVADYLLGVNRLDPVVRQMLRPVDPPALATSEIESLAERLERLVTTSIATDRIRLVSLVGPAERGSAVLAHALAERLGIGLFSIEMARLPAAHDERQELYRVLEREAMLLPALYYLDLTRVDLQNRADLAAAMELVDEVRAFTIVASRDRLSTAMRTVVVDVPPLEADDQLQLWRSALARVPEASRTVSDEFLRGVIPQFDLGPQAIDAVVAGAVTVARLRDPEQQDLVPADLWRACRVHAAQSIEGLAQRLTPASAWDDIILPADTMRQLRELADQVGNRSHVYEQWGFGRRLARGRGINALFAGPSGTGKTMAAEILAGHLQLDLFRIDLAGVVSKYIGESEKNLRRVFEAAERSGAILFFDEADALFGKRSEVKDSHDRYANLEINYLLQRMEEYRGLAILATNMKGLLDHAFLRRLRYIVDFPFPDASLRLRIWQSVFPPETEVDGVDFEFLARLEIAGGNIRNIAVNAAFLAAAEGLPVRMIHVLRAARREYSKLDKLVLESEFGPYFRIW